VSELGAAFFDRPATVVARALVGKVLRRRRGDVWLAAAVVEAEAYFEAELGSHASQGRTPSREALYAPPGTIYMYHSRAGDSLNVSARGDGNAVLFKSAAPFFDARSPEADALPVMQRLNPKRGGGPREVHRQCAGQTLLCRSLDLRIRDWDGRPFDPEVFYVDDVGYEPARVVVAPRHGIPAGRDEHLPYRYLDEARLRSATIPRLPREGYFVVTPADSDPNGDGPSSD
jgi:DNA-3-methyladenine glycosylase